MCTIATLLACVGTVYTICMALCVKVVTTNVLVIDSLFGNGKHYYWCLCVINKYGCVGIHCIY